MVVQLVNHWSWSTNQIAIQATIHSPVNTASSEQIKIQILRLAVVSSLTDSWTEVSSAPTGTGDTLGDLWQQLCALPCPASGSL